MGGPALFGGNNPCRPKVDKTTNINIGGSESALGCVYDGKELTGKVVMVQPPVSLSIAGCSEPEKKKPHLYFIGIDGSCKEYDPIVHGAWKECQQKPCPINEILNDGNSEYCGHQLFEFCGILYVYDLENGWVEINPSEHDLSQSFSTGYSTDPKTDKENLTPYSIDGPFAALDLNTIIDDLLAASLNTDFDQAQMPIEAADVKECGSVTVATKDGHKGIVINGDSAYPLSSWTWNGGISGLDTIEILDGCSVWVTACAEKEYTPVK